MNRIVRTIALTLAITGIPAAAMAHHGFTGQYDNTQPLWLQGTVSSVVFQYPHAIIELSVASGEGTPERPASADFLSADPVIDTASTGQTVRLEFPPISRFNSLEGQLNSGDQVSLIAYRNCEEPNQLRVQWIRLVDGTEVARAGSVQTEVEGCQP